MKNPVGTSVVFALSLLAALPAAAQTCGDYLREAPEQCDDGNLLNLDGCDANCRFEQSMRITDLRLQRTVAPSSCPATKFGSAFTSGTQDLVNGGLGGSIAGGAISIVFRIGGLDDLSGNSDPAVSVGVLSGRVVGHMGAYDGTNDRDWWHAIDANVIDAQRQPLFVLPGSITSRVLNAGPGTANLNLVIAGTPTTLKMSSMTVKMTNSTTTTAPAVSLTGDPPGHLALEHLDPALTSYVSASVPGTPVLPPTGVLCGNIGTQSLAQTVIPSFLRGVACNNFFDASNSFLDAIVAGCGTSINATQPDTEDPGQPPAGGGPPYTLTFDGTHHVNGCNDKDAQPVDLATCLADAGYSSFWRFAAGRVVAADDLVLRDSFETGDLSAWTSAQTDGGDLRVDPSAQLGPGTPNGLLATINDSTPLFVEDTRPDNENRYRARFLLDPTGFDPGEALNKRRVRLFIAFEDGPRRLIAVILRRLSGQYAIQVRARQDDNSQANTPFTDITAGPHRIEFDWIRASGPDANDGQLRLWIDDVLISTLTGLDNSVSTVDFARFGALAVKVGASGPLKLDYFESRRFGKAAP
jgi:cysteine-rich repeat protein